MTSKPVTKDHDSISRQAAIEALGEKPLAWVEGEYELGLQNQWECDVDAIKTLPSVDAVPVVHGRWIVHYGNWADVYECDQCRHESKEGGKYCSNCGARMDGKQL